MLSTARTSIAAKDCMVGNVESHPEFPRTLSYPAILLQALRFHSNALGMARYSESFSILELALRLIILIVPIVVVGSVGVFVMTPHTANELSIRQIRVGLVLESHMAADEPWFVLTNGQNTTSLDTINLPRPKKWTFAASMVL